MTQQLNRQTFTTSRLMDFFSEKELIAQIGHGKHDWPQVCIKELVDNSLDACEDACIAPEIKIRVDDIGISVSDNGPGIPHDTVVNMLDYTIKVSSREAYVSPDRGAQGNALKTIVAMPFVLDGEKGRVDIYTQGLKHSIICKVDRIRQQPAIEHGTEESDVKTGTHVVVHWPDLACSELSYAKRHFLQMAEAFVFLNPHLSLSVDWFGESNEWAATDPAWTSWSSSSPTSPHWYQDQHLSRLISAYLGQDDEKTVREFISEFRGLAGSAKQKKVLDDTGLARLPLTALIKGDDLDQGKISALLAAMKAHTKPVGAKLLGIVGKDHIYARIEALGCEMNSFQYTKHMELVEGVPTIAEMAFAWFGDVDKSRKLITGVNWSAGIVNPFRELGKQGDSLDSVLSKQYAGRNEPIVMVAHMACPRVQYSDRGKSAVIMEG